MDEFITAAALTRRAYWVEEIRKLSGRFGDDVDRLQGELDRELADSGAATLIEHLRLCGDIPESYAHDSSEEKLYSKYTDLLLAAVFRAVGMRSLVLRERADAADVEVFARDYSFVADAKSFRLSRTAKNQKDFKIQAMDGWKRGKLYALVVCPLHQLPEKSSQIYAQASARHVCVLTYSHLAMLVGFAQTANGQQAEDLLHAWFAAVAALNPSKDAGLYWSAINRTMLEFSPSTQALWQTEKQASLEAVVAAKAEALALLAQEREAIMRMSHQDALLELVRVHKLDSRTRTVEAVGASRILTMV